MTRVRHSDVEYFFEYNLDLNSRTIFLGFGQDEECDVDQYLASSIIKSLHILDRTKQDHPITILINCQGGDTQHGMAIFDAISMCKSQVHGIVVGHAYSMGAWILQACDLRSMTKYSSMMIHDGDGVMSGRKEELKQWKKFYDEMDLLCQEILYSRIREKQPAFPLSKLKTMLKTDTLLWPQQAIDLGLCDNILE